MLQGLLESVTGDSMRPISLPMGEPSRSQRVRISLRMPVPRSWLGEWLVQIPQSTTPLQ